MRHTRTAPRAALAKRASSIPILGIVGLSGIERAFCHWAHQLILAQRRGEPGPIRPARFCLNCHGGDCGLVADQHGCLFFHLADPCWALIRASIRYQHERIPPTALG